MNHSIGRDSCSLALTNSHFPAFSYALRVAQSREFFAELLGTAVLVIFGTGTIGMYLEQGSNSLSRWPLAFADFPF